MSKSLASALVCRLLLISAFCLIPSHAAGRAAERIVLVQTMPVPIVERHMESVKNSLRELGYVQGETAFYETVYAKGSLARAEERLRQIKNSYRPDVVITVATLATQAAWKVFGGTDVPVVFCVVSDPVGAGIIEAINRPTGANVTGRVFTLPRRTMLGFAQELATQLISDRPVRYGVIHSDYPSSISDVRMLRETVREAPAASIAAYDFPYREMPAGLEEMLADAESGIQALEGEVDFWWEVSGPLGEVREFPKLLMSKSDKPMIFGNKLETMEMGALLAVCLDPESGGKEVAGIADRILRGADPGRIPVTPPDNFDLGVNLKTALKLGIVVPSRILELADENIYR